MVTFLLVLAGLLILSVLYLLMLRGRTGHPMLPILRKYVYAHRGLYGGGIPENSLQAFREAFDRGYGIEFDLHLLKDGNIGIMHDSQMQRTTGQQQILEELSTEDLPRFHLESTEETVPTFSQVLDLCHGRVPLIIELKSWKGNADALCAAACRMLEGYSGPFCLESFDPRCVLWLKKNRSELCRGQLSENFCRSKTVKAPWILRFLASYHMESFVTRPDFIAHRFSDRNTHANWLIRRLWKVQGVTWTVDTMEDFRQAEKEGWIPIFEHILPKDL